MRLSTLEILRCPFCGDRLRLERSALLDVRDDDVLTGVLYCHCCAYPVVSGIPYIRATTAAKRALSLLGQRNTRQALFSLLELDGLRERAFTALLEDEQALTFASALRILGPEAESTYLLYRFSDPTFLVARAVLRALAQDDRAVAGRILDIGGGAGHLTQALSGRTALDRVILSDFAFWKLWLGKGFVAPGCEACCCDANSPLPFAGAAFSLAYCSDAFHYVWSRRLLADEMVRAVGDRGVAVLAHVHNALCENESAGMPLPPEGYAGLFEELPTRLFKESSVLAAVLERQPIDLSVRLSEADLAGEPALILLATRLPGIFRVYAPSAPQWPLNAPALNPLYRVESTVEGSVLTLEFPSAQYEQEYGVCKRYLPARVPLTAPLRAALSVRRWNGDLAGLVERCVLLDLPERYL